MLLLILYVIVQLFIGLYSRDFSLLAKSSDIFAILSTIDIALSALDLDKLISEIEIYLLNNLYHSFKRKYIKRLDNIYLRCVQTFILILISLIFQFL